MISIPQHQAVLIKNGQLKARLGVLMMGMAEFARQGRQHCAAEWIRKADEAAASVKLEDVLGPD